MTRPAHTLLSAAALEAFQAGHAGSIPVARSHRIGPGQGRFSGSMAGSPFWRSEDEPALPRLGEPL
jgi:hypothetical protein